MAKTLTRKAGDRYACELCGAKGDERKDVESHLANFHPAAVRDAGGDPDETLGTSEAEGDASDEDAELESQSKDDLKELAKSLDLPVSGSKDELIERIREAQASDEGE